MQLLHDIHQNARKLVIIINQNFSLVDEVSSWSNDLVSL